MKIVTKQMTEGSGSGFVFWPGSGPEKIRGLGSGLSWEVWFGSGPGQHETGSETLSRIWKYHQRQSWATTHHWVRTLPWHRWCQAGSWPESSSARTTYPGTGKYTNSNTNILSIPKLEYTLSPKAKVLTHVRISAGRIFRFSTLLHGDIGDCQGFWLSRQCNKLHTFFSCCAVLTEQGISISFPCHSKLFQECWEYVNLTL